MFSVICLFVWSKLFILGASTTVEVTAPINSVSVGDILAIQCQIWNIQNGDDVTIIHVFNGGSERITTGSNIVDSSVKERVFLSIRSFPDDGSVVYFITLIDVSESDKGEYGCSISRLSGVIPVQVTHDTVIVQTKHYPDKSQPTCTSNPNKEILTEGSRVEFTCSAYKTFPIVNLRWRLIPSYQYIAPVRNSSEGEYVFSKVIIVATKAHEGAELECEMTSQGFPDRKQYCRIGPLSILKSRDNSVSETSLVTMFSGGSSVTTKPVTDFGAEECMKTSCKSSSFTAFIVTLSTFATCILTVVFLITTIVMCCKYHNISAEVNRESGHQYIQSRASDPMYVSLQRRRDQEQVYMTLEDPNNPEGKVLLPKEVFDQFYNRTLSIQKT